MSWIKDIMQPVTMGTITDPPELKRAKDGCIILADVMNLPTLSRIERVGKDKVLVMRGDMTADYTPIIEEIFGVEVVTESWNSGVGRRESEIGRIKGVYFRK